MLGLHNVDLLHYEPCAHSAESLKMISPHSLLWPGVTAPVLGFQILGIMNLQEKLATP